MLINTGMPYPSANKRRAFAWLLCLAILLLPAHKLQCQARWDGEAGDGQWTTPANWAGNTLPANTDDVLLDNSLLAGNYSVVLPGGLVAVSISSISITPGSSNSIRLVLPAASTATPAFSVTGPGYAITLNNGAVLLNASGATSAAAISVTDSLRINNGGNYIHNSRSAHAVLVSSLSRLPGTEKGIFSFDVPGGGYTIASTNRVYGTLQLLATASGGSQVYATSAANPFTINGDLLINNGVSVNLDITAPTVIKGNYIQEGGVFNLASQANNNTVFVAGDLLQTGGAITETAGGLPAIELNGHQLQQLRMGGVVSNSVGFRINNPAGIVLLSNCSLPYDLSLVNGIVHTQSFLVTLLPGCTIHADSTGNNNFINGPLRKEGLLADQHFLFPVGKDITQRWLALKDASGNYTVQFFKGNPNTLAGSTGPGIHHISSIEYWSVLADAVPAPSTRVELSFDNVNSGGVTNMASLRATQFVAGVWTDQGNTGTTGTAGSAGSVISKPVAAFGSFAQYFTLASSDAFQNPLPLKILSFTGERSDNGTLIKWVVAQQVVPAFFELQSSADGNRFTTLARIEQLKNNLVYQYVDKGVFTEHNYYRLKCIEDDGSFFYSRQIEIMPFVVSTQELQLWPNPATSSAVAIITALAAGETIITINGAGGAVFTTRHVYLQKGPNRVPLDLKALPAGPCWITISKHNGRTIAARLIKMTN